MDWLTIVVPYRDERAALERLLASLPAGIPAIVVDDASDVPALPTSHAKVLRRQQRGFFSGAVNVGLQACDTDVLVVNQDTWFEGDAWTNQLRDLRHRYALIGDGVMRHPAWPNGYVQGTCMFMRRDAIKVVGLLDEVDWPLWGATCEWQLRASRRGYKALPLGNLGWVKHARKGDYGASITKLLKSQPDKRGLWIRTPPRVSVVTACYNYGRYLADMVHSLIGGKTSLGEMPAQTYAGFEVIIVDDASTDHSREIAEQLADGWTGVRLIARPKRGGTAAAMNTGIDAAFGRYIMALDADDMLESTAIERCLRVVQADEYVAPYPDQTLFNKGKRGARVKLREYDFDGVLERNAVPAGIMFAKDGWVATGGYPESFDDGRQDWAFAVALGAKGYCPQRLAEPLYLYRREGQNRTLKNTNPQDRDRFTLKMKATFPELYAGERPMGCCGGGARRAQAKAGKGGGQPVQTPAPGAEGMVLMEYIGGNLGRTTWYGAETRTRYTCSGSRRKFYADTHDVKGLLDIVYDRQPAFRKVVIPPPPAPPQAAPAPRAPAPPEVNNPALATVEVIPQMPEPEPEPEPIPEPMLVAEPLLEPDPIAVVEAPAPKRKYTRKAKIVEAVDA